MKTIVFIIALLMSTTIYANNNETDLYITNIINEGYYCAYSGEENKKIPVYVSQENYTIVTKKEVVIEVLYRIMTDEAKTEKISRYKLKSSQIPVICTFIYQSISNVDYVSKDKFTELFTVTMHYFDKNNIDKYPNSLERLANATTSYLFSE